MLNISRAPGNQWSLKIRGYYAENNKKYTELVPRIENIIKNNFTGLHIPKNLSTEQKNMAVKARKIKKET